MYILYKFIEFRMKRQDGNDSETAQNAGYQIRKRNYERSEERKND